jgi:hypothetical protein
LATDVVELLVERGADLSIADSNDCTALSYVSGPMFVDDRAAVALIGAGAPLEDVDALCRIASLSGRVCQMLLDRNVNVAQLRDGFEATPCHAACDRGERAVRDSPEILDFLANVAKVDINVADTKRFDMFAPVCDSGRVPHVALVDQRWHGRQRHDPHWHDTSVYGVHRRITTHWCRCWSPPAPM